VYDQRIAVDSARTRAILLPRPLLDLDHIAAWLSKYDILRPIPSLVVVAIDPLVRRLEAGFLELAIAAEGLHRRLEPGALNPAITCEDTQRVRSAALNAAGDNTVLRQRVSDALSH
jgi:hypothetical protein